MITGELPFKGSDLLASKQQKKVIPPTEINKDIPKYIESLTLKCLEPERDNRPRNADEVLKKLKS